MMSSKDVHNGNRRKRKRTPQDAQTPPYPQPTLTAIACSKCGLELPSRNKLFQHLRASKNCSLDGSNNNARENDGKETKFVKVILVLAYLGKAYHGSARNDHHDSVPTVEGCLWKAIALALSERTNGNDDSFAIQIQQHTNPKAMTRSSRTDKGVSSLGNVYSLLLPDVDVFADEGSFTSSINHHLPNDIRLLRLHMGNSESNSNIPSSFNARTCCEARRYRYLVPAKAVLRPRGEGEDDGPAESVLNLRKRLKQVLLQWGGTHSFHNFTNWRQQSSSSLETKQSQQPERQQKGCNDAEGDAKEPASHMRHVLRCHVEDVIQHSQQDFLVISIKGQSFLYHQIRKMIGATIGVMNGSLPSDFIARALKKEDEAGENMTITVPLAPAEGLVLVESTYSKYCSKHKTEPIGLGTKLLSRGNSGGKAVARSSSDYWEAAAAKLLKDTQEFQELVYEQICRDQAKKFFLL